MSNVLPTIGHSLDLSFGMFWEILWGLILGFLLSAVIESVVSRSEMVRLLPDDSPRTLAVATALGAASSSCSYAAVAIARSVIRKGANFTAAMAFEIASTNLVVELGVILAVLIGWKFTLAEFIGGPIMIILLAILWRIFLRRKLVEEAVRQADKGLTGSMEGHATMDMAVHGGSLWSRLRSRNGFTTISHNYFMGWASVYRDIAIGLIIAGFLAATVPDSTWHAIFLTDHPTLSKVWGPIVGPLVSVAAFVCSVGNVPLAGVLWNGGASFGGVISFIFADLLILPILNIYRKYYGWKMTGFIFVTFYVTMALAGFVTELIFDLVHATPTVRDANITNASVTWNYDTILNIAFLLVTAVLAVRFLRTGGVGMLRMMGGSPDARAHRGAGADAAASS